MTLRIFLSYRRADTGGRYLAHMIFRELSALYGEDSAFLDVDSRSPGLSFPLKVQTALNRSDAVLVVIGADWMSQLTRRERDERDWVKYEVAESLKRPHLPVVPVCHVDATFPVANQLPPELRDLAYRDGISLDPFQGFQSQFAHLLKTLERTVREQKSQRNEDLNQKDQAAEQRIHAAIDSKDFAAGDRIQPPAADRKTPAPARATSEAAPIDREAADERYFSVQNALLNHGRNSILTAAHDLLLLGPQLRATARVADVPALRASIVEGLREFENAAVKHGVAPDKVTIARYILCTMLDEAAATTPWGGSGAWISQSLLTQFFNETWGGEKVFEILKKSAEAPEQYIELLELMYVTISLGFAGRYGIVDDGRLQLSEIRRKLHQLIVLQRSGTLAHR